MYVIFKVNCVKFKKETYYTKLLSPLPFNLCSKSVENNVNKFYFSAMIKKHSHVENKVCKGSWLSIKRSM